MRKVDGHWRLERSDIPITNDIFAQQFVGARPGHLKRVFRLLSRKDNHSFAIFWPRDFIKPDPESTEEWDIWIREVEGGGVLNKYCDHRGPGVEEAAIREGTRLPTTINPKDYK